MSQCNSMEFTIGNANSIVYFCIFCLTLLVSHFFSLVHYCPTIIIMCIFLFANRCLSLNWSTSYIFSFSNTFSLSDTISLSYMMSSLYPLSSTHPLVFSLCRQLVVLWVSSVLSLKLHSVSLLLPLESFGLLQFFLSEGARSATVPVRVQTEAGQTIKKASTFSHKSQTLLLLDWPSDIGPSHQSVKVRFPKCKHFTITATFSNLKREQEI